MQITRVLTITGLSALFSLGATFYPIDSVTSDHPANDFFTAQNLIEGPGVGFDAVEPHDRTSTLTWVTDAPNAGSATTSLRFQAPPRDLSLTLALPFP